MKIVDLQQGSELWHEHRRTHFNASDAPAMMGCSPYKTRSELMRELHTGITAEVDAQTADRFAAGHRFEALARPLGEAIVGEDFYAIVKANGKLSASLDGQTLLGDTDWEHKTLSAELRELLPETGVGSTVLGEALPLHYRVQIAHQHHCGGAQRTLFTASKWASDGTLIEARHCWVARDEELIARVLAGWAQFEADMEGYVPPERAPVVSAAAVEHLPAVSVQVQGALAVVSNLDRFGVALRAFVDRIPKEPSTDQEFADTDAACKRLKEAEERLQAAEDSALASLSDVETMRTAVASLRDLARTTRLASEKLVAARKQQIREQEVQRGRAEFAAHFKALADRLGGPYLPPYMADFGAVIKGLKTLDSVRDKIDTEVARLKIETSALADKVAANLKAIDAAGAPTLFPDKAALVLKAPDDLAAQIEFRLVQERRRQEAERERIRAEEAAHADRAAAAAAAAADAAAAKQNYEARDPQQVLKAEPATADATDRDVPATASPRVGAMGVGQAADAAAAGDDRPPIKLGDICERLGFNVTAAFVTETLRIKPVGTDKRAVLLAQADFPRICDALVKHIQVKAAAC